MTIPAARMRLTLERGGDRWDAIRVPLVIGETVMVRLGAACGSVVSDGMRMWFFVDPGDGWELEMPGVIVINRSGHVLMPAEGIVSLPGPHWARVSYQLNTNTPRLLTALKRVLS